MEKPVKSKSLFWSRILASFLALMAIGGVTYAIKNPPPPRPESSPPPFPVASYNPFDPPSMTTPTPALPLTQTYSNTTQGFTLKIPNGWSTNERTQATTRSREYTLTITSPERQAAINRGESLGLLNDFSLIVYDGVKELPFNSNGSDLETWLKKYQGSDMEYSGHSTRLGRTIYIATVRQAGVDKVSGPIYFVQEGNRIYRIMPFVQDSYAHIETGEAIFESLDFIK